MNPSQAPPAIQMSNVTRVLLTVDERDDLADGTANLAQGSGGITDGRTSGSGGLGETLLSLGSSLAGLLGVGRGVSDGGSPGQELRLPQHGTGGSGHVGDCEGGGRSEIKRPGTSHPGQLLVKGRGGPMAIRLAQRHDQNLRIGTRELQGTVVT